MGVGFLQPPRKSNAGKRLADTHSMNPDRARGMRGQLVERRKSEPQAFPKVRDILSVAQSLDEPIGHQQKGREAHEKAINEIH